MVNRSYWHGTTARRWANIQNEGLKEKSPVADSLYLPVTFACRRAEDELDDAVILKVCAPVKYFVKWNGGWAVRAFEAGDGQEYITKTKIPLAHIKIVDEIPYAEAKWLYHSKRRMQSYRKHLRQADNKELLDILANSQT